MILNVKTTRHKIFPINVGAGTLGTNSLLLSLSLSLTHTHTHTLFDTHTHTLTHSLYLCTTLYERIE